MYLSSPKAKRVEFRPPDPLTNPYLGFSAMLMAGLDGIKRGLKPGNPDGSFVQKVPLVGYTSDTKAEITAKGKKLTLAPRTDYVASSRRYIDEVKVPATDIVFVGYGIVAPGAISHRPEVHFRHRLYRGQHPWCPQYQDCDPFVGGTP